MMSPSTQPAPQCVDDAFRRDDPGVIDREQRRPPSTARQRFEGIKDRLMFDAAGDQVTAPRDFECFIRSPDGEVVCLRAATREDDLRRVGIQEGGDRGSRRVDGRFRLLAEVVNAGRVAERIARCGD